MNWKKTAREKKIRVGEDFLNVEIYPSFEPPKPGRSKRQQESTPKQRNLNDKNSQKWLIRIIKANFGEGDFRLDLTYNRWFCPTTPEEHMRNGRNLIRRLRDEFRRAGAGFKFVLVNSWGISPKTGKPVRPHHHLIISGGLTLEQVSKVWRGRGKKGRSYGYVSYSPLVMDEDTGIAGLANYLADQPTAGVRRFSCSQNLRRPWYTTNNSRYTLRQIARMVGAEPYKAYGSECRTLINYEKWNGLYSGWRLVEYAPEFNEDMSAWYVSLWFRRDDGPPNGGKQRR